MRTPTIDHPQARPVRARRRARRRPGVRGRGLLAAAITLSTVAVGVLTTTPHHTAPLEEVHLTSAGEVYVDGRPVVLAVRAHQPVSDQVRERYAEAAVTVSRSGDRQVVRVHTPATVTLTADGTSHTVTTTADSPAAALAEAGVDVGPLDETTVIPDGATDTARDSLQDGDHLRVVRVRRTVTTQVQTIPASTRRRPTDTLPAGQHRVLAAGAAGSRTVQVTTVTRDGQVSSRRRTVLARTAPRVRVVAVGTGVPAAARVAASQDGGPVAPTVAALNWAGLARCESSGNPAAVNPAGYYGLYQFNLGTWRSVGGAGNPAHASAAEQTYRAQVLYRSRGRSPWPYCGRFL